MRPRVTRQPRNLVPGSSLSTLNSVSEQPLTPCAVSYRPKVILSTPCGTIREEVTGNGHESMIHTNFSQRRSMSVKSTPRGTPNPDFAWGRRHSIHNQPQPLSVQGFGHRYGQRNRKSADVDRMSADLSHRKSTADLRVNMVAGRPTSISGEDNRPSAMMTTLNTLTSRSRRHSSIGQAKHEAFNIVVIETNTFLERARSARYSHSKIMIYDSWLENISL